MGMVVLLVEGAEVSVSATMSEGLARLGVERCICGKMHAIGADARGERCVICDETGDSAFLHQSEKGRGIVVCLRRIRTKQDAGRIGAGDGVCEPAHKLGRRVHWKLKI